MAIIVFIYLFRRETSSPTYQDAGVDVQGGEEFVEIIKDIVTPTHTPEVLETLGGFGALYDRNGTVLVSGTDGVGTKLMVG